MIYVIHSIGFFHSRVHRFHYATTIYTKLEIADIREFCCN